MASKKKTNWWFIIQILGACLLLGCCGVASFITLLVPAIMQSRETADRSLQLNEMSMIGKAIFMYHDQNKRMPAKAEDLQPFVSDLVEEMPLRVGEHLRAGEINVIWNAVSFEEETRGPSNVIIAWFTKPVKGGFRAVLFMDGTVRLLTESELQTTPKVRVVEKK